MRNKPNLTKNELNHLHNKDLRSVERPATNKRRPCWPQPPKYAIRHTRYEIIYAKQTQFHHQRTYAQLDQRSTGHESRLNMQNEPNSNRNSTIEIRKSLQLSIRQMPTFPQKSQKMRNFCKLLKLTHLNTCTTKAYITFHPKIRFNQRETRVERQATNKYAKQTQFRPPRPPGHGSRETSHDLCKTNPISTHPGSQCGLIYLQSL